ncbi:MAG: AraC family transcriptional regulator [Proteobacteria bacterium]|nr:AraC family transcriptional regulator [Pseudomonadota bacterium]
MMKQIKIDKRKQKRTADLILKAANQDGITETKIRNLFLFKDTTPENRTLQVYDPSIVIAVQGKKDVFIEELQFEYGEGMFLATLLPVPLECVVTEGSPEKPLLGLAFALDKTRLSKLMVKMNIQNEPEINLDKINTSSIFSAPLNNEILDAAFRLMTILADPMEATVLGDAIMDEICFRVLRNEQEGVLTYLLQQKGQIHQISKAVEMIHNNLEKPLNVDDLANLVNLSRSRFHTKFKEVMHLSPLQYAKSIKLTKARDYIAKGKNISETGYLVGYNSPAQFSREYKRYFGMSPSEHNRGSN